MCMAEYTGPCTFWKAPQSISYALAKNILSQNKGSGGEMAKDGAWLVGAVMKSETIYADQL